MEENIKRKLQELENSDKTWTRAVAGIGKAVGRVGKAVEVVNDYARGTRNMCILYNEITADVKTYLLTDAETLPPSLVKLGILLRDEEFISSFSSFVALTLKELSKDSDDDSLMGLMGLVDLRCLMTDALAALATPQGKQVTENVVSSLIKEALTATGGSGTSMSPILDYDKLGAFFRDMVVMEDIQVPLSAACGSAARGVTDVLSEKGRVSDLMDVVLEVLKNEKQARQIAHYVGLALGTGYLHLFHGVSSRENAKEPAARGGNRMETSTSLQPTADARFPLCAAPPATITAPPPPRVEKPSTPKETLEVEEMWQLLSVPTGRAAHGANSNAQHKGEHGANTLAVSVKTVPAGGSEGPMAVQAEADIALGSTDVSAILREGVRIAADQAARVLLEPQEAAGYPRGYLDKQHVASLLASSLREEEVRSMVKEAIREVARECIFASKQETSRLWSAAWQFSHHQYDQVHQWGSSLTPKGKLAVLVVLFILVLLVPSLDLRLTVAILVVGTTAWWLRMGESLAALGLSGREGEGGGGLVGGEVKEKGALRAAEVETTRGLRGGEGEGKGGMWSPREPPVPVDGGVTPRVPGPMVA